MIRGHLRLGVNSVFFKSSHNECFFRALNTCLGVSFEIQDQCCAQCFDRQGHDGRTLRMHFTAHRWVCVCLVLVSDRVILPHIDSRVDV